MYQVLNNNIEQILSTIEDGHVTEYDWLVENIDQMANPGYQKKYRSYWRMYAARLTDDFCRNYFEHLQSGLRDGVPRIADLARELYAVPTHKEGRRSLQFSFCSKLCHMIDRQIPIYDSRIKNFYSFSEPKGKLPFERRIDIYCQFHQFLIEEYGRIIREGFLSHSILAFRHRFEPRYFTDMKVIDSLIWGFVNLSQNGGLTD